MKNTAKTILYFIVMISISFGHCFGNQAPYPSAPNFDLQGQERHFPSEQPINITIAQFDALTQRISVLESANQQKAEINNKIDNIEEFINNLLQQQMVQNATIYYTREELNQIINKKDTKILTLERMIEKSFQQYFQHNAQTYCTKQELVNLQTQLSQLALTVQQLEKKSQDYCTKEELKNFNTDLLTKIAQLQQNFQSLQTQYNSQQVVINSLQLTLQGIQATHAGQSTQVFFNNNHTTTTQQNNVEVVSHSSNFYSKLFNVKNIIAIMLILGAFASNGPEGAVFATGLTGCCFTGCYLLFGINKEILEKWERFKKRAKIFGTGAALMFTSGCIACTTRDKDVAMGAGVCTLLSFCGTIVALDAE